MFISKQLFLRYLFHFYSEYFFKLKNSSLLYKILPLRAFFSVETLITLEKIIAIYVTSP
jgi:hypothetical protein